MNQITDTASFALLAGEPGFDPIEERLRANVRATIEAVFEDKQVKSDVFQKLDDLCSDPTIPATNTSSFYVREFAGTGTGGVATYVRDQVRR